MPLPVLVFFVLHFFFRVVTPRMSVMVSYSNETPSNGGKLIQARITNYCDGDIHVLG